MSPRWVLSLSQVGSELEFPLRVHGQDLVLRSYIMTKTLAISLILLSLTACGYNRGERALSGGAIGAGGAALS